MSVKNETHENIDDEFNEDELNEIDRLGLDQKKWCNGAFYSELKNTNK